MTNLTLYFYKKNVYGNELIYPADKDQAQCVAMMTGKKTLSSRFLQGIALFGVELVECHKNEKTGVFTPLRELKNK